MNQPVPFRLVDFDESYSHADWACSNALNRPAKPPHDTSPPSPSILPGDYSLQRPSHNRHSLLEIRAFPDKERIYTDDDRTLRTLMMVRQLTPAIPAHPTAVAQGDA